MSPILLAETASLRGAGTHGKRFQIRIDPPTVAIPSSAAASESWIFAEDDMILVAQGPEVRLDRAQRQRVAKMKKPQAAQIASRSIQIGATTTLAGAASDFDLDNVTRRKSQGLTQKLVAAEHRFFQGRALFGLL
jgi:hypothetical protein